MILSFKNKGEKKGYFSINKNQTSGHRQNNVLKKVGEGENKNTQSKRWQERWEKEHKVRINRKHLRSDVNINTSVIIWNLNKLYAIIKRQGVLDGIESKMIWCIHQIALKHKCTESF